MRHPLNVGIVHCGRQNSGPLWPDFLPPQQPEATEGQRSQNPSLGDFLACTCGLWFCLWRLPASQPPQSPRCFSCWFYEKSLEYVHEVRKSWGRKEVYDSAMLLWIHCIDSLYKASQYFLPVDHKVSPLCVCFAEHKVIIVGLDNAGKTTILYQL